MLHYFPYLGRFPHYILATLTLGPVLFSCPSYTNRGYCCPYKTVECPDLLYSSSLFSLGLQVAPFRGRPRDVVVAFLSHPRRDSGHTTMTRHAETRRKALTWMHRRQGRSRDRHCRIRNQCRIFRTSRSGSWCIRTRSTDGTVRLVGLGQHS